MADDVKENQINVEEQQTSAPEVQDVQNPESQEPKEQTQILEESKPPEKKQKPSEISFDVKVFGKWDVKGIEINDPSMRNVISLVPIQTPHTHARHANKPFEKQKLNVVERLVNKLMRGGTGGKLKGRVIRTAGRGQGKKLQSLKIVERAFDIINQKTGENPIQVLIRALENSAPREETTRVEHGGVTYQVAVDSSAYRRVDMALQNISLACVMASFNNKKPAEVALADEIISAAQNAATSYAVQRKDEIERIALSAR